MRFSFPWSGLTLSLGIRRVLLATTKAAGEPVQPRHANTQTPLCYLLAKEEQSCLEIYDSRP